MSLQSSSEPPAELVGLLLALGIGIGIGKSSRSRRRLGAAAEKEEVNAFRIRTDVLPSYVPKTPPPHRAYDELSRFLPPHPTSPLHLSHHCYTSGHHYYRPSFEPMVSPPLSRLTPPALPRWLRLRCILRPPCMQLISSPSAKGPPARNACLPGSNAIPSSWYW